MSILNEAVEAAMDLIDSLDLFAPITRGALGTKSGLCCEVAPSTAQETYLDKNRYIPIDLTINGKHENLQTLSEAMNKIHEELPTMTDYTAGNGWQIVDITTATLPQIIGREANNIWIMASSLTVKVATSDPEPEPEPEPGPDPDPEPEPEPTPDGE